MSEDEEEIVNSLKEEISDLNKENAELRAKLAAATCDALEKALKKIDELQNKLEEYEPDEADWEVDTHSYAVCWMEEWGCDQIYCGSDFDKAKKIFTGKQAEGKNQLAIEQTITKYCYPEDDENEDS